MSESDIVFKKTYKCPICDSSFKNLTVKQGKVRPEGTDLDLKPKYKNIEPLKYDVLLCPMCGYASLERYFLRVSQKQKEDIYNKICNIFNSRFEDKDELTFEDAVIRYKFAIITCQTKMAKESETGFVCLKFGWLYRSYKESVSEDDENLYAQLSEREKFFLEKAYACLLKARETEHGEICGMDEITFDCLLAGLSVELEKFDDSKRLISGILTSRVASKRAKDRARDLKDFLENIEKNDEEE